MNINYFNNISNPLCRRYSNQMCFFMKLKFYLPFLLLSVSFGCFKSADRNKAELLTSPSLNEISKKALASSSFEEVDQRSEKWWEMFESSNLNDLMERALAHSPTLKLAESKIVTAQAGAKSVRSKLFPTLTASAVDNWVYLSKYGFDRDFFPLGDSDNLIPAKFNETDLSLNFSYEFDFWGKNRKRLKEALGLAFAEQMEKYQAELIICQAVAFSYFQWQLHTKEKNLYEKWIQSQEKLHSYFSFRYKKGLGNTLSPLGQNQLIGALKQKIIDLENQREIDLFFLKNLLGEGPESSLSLSFQENDLSQKIQIPESLELNLLAQRPDLMAQIWRVSSASEAIGVAKTQFYPNVNLAALAGLSSLSLNHLFDWASRTGSLTPAINLPLFTGWDLTANLNRKVSLFNEAVHSYNEQLLKAASQVAQEVTTFISIQNQTKIQEDVVGFQRKTYEISSLKYEKGIENLQPMVEASLLLFSQELTLVQLKHSQILSSLRVIQSLGGGMGPKKTPSSLYP